MSYGTTTLPTYGATTAYAAPTMAYGAGYGATPQQPYLDEKVIETQKLDATNALTNQAMLQQQMALDQQFKTQSMQLDMAKQQREMMITQQASQMTAQAQQYQMQIDMQQKMASLYGSGMAGATGA